MNCHLKLRELGFKKSPLLKPNEGMSGSPMILDDVDISYVVGDDRIRRKVETKKVHRKSDSFYILEYDSRYTIWIKIINNNIATIWLSDLDVIKKRPYLYPRGDLTVLYDCKSYTAPKITSTKQIINLLPLTIKRDFILARLFK